MLPGPASITGYLLWRSLRENVLLYRSDWVLGILSLSPTSGPSFSMWDARFSGYARNAVELTLYWFSADQSKVPLLHLLRQHHSVLMDFCL